MKYLFTFFFILSSLFASLSDISSIEADFTQNIKDEKNKVLSYSGHLKASKPQNAHWSYTKPVTKDVYINFNKVTIIEPEIEQVTIKHIESNFDFFSLIKNAKQIEKDKYVAIYKEAFFTVLTKNSLIKSISYTDEFENSVEILFSNEKINITIDENDFIPLIPNTFDTIVD